MTGARDIPAVIDARLCQSLNGLAPQADGRWSDRVPQVADPEIKEYLGKLATLMDERRDPDRRTRGRTPASLGDQGTWGRAG